VSGRQRQGKGAGRAKGAGAPERRGLLGGLFTPRAAVDTPMPSIRGSIARGLATTLASPVLVVGVVVVVALEWLVVVAAGFQGPFALLVNAFALPPIGTLTDVTVTGSALGSTAGLVGIVVAVVVRAVLLALVAAAGVEGLRTGGVSRWFPVTALRALPTTLSVNLLAISLLLTQILVGSILGSILGGVGLLVFFGVLVLGVAWLGFAPAIAAVERRRLTDVLGRSVRAARMPGSGNLTFAVLYVLPSYAVLVAPGKPGGTIGVNPSVGAWVLVLVVNLLHVAVTVAFAYRYLSVADVVPEDAPRARPPRPRR
jgi:hypothetical protein